MRHTHAKSMAQYAQDAMETEKPWERWEHKSQGRKSFHRCIDYLLDWNPRTEYRRIKPKTEKQWKWVVIPYPLTNEPWITSEHRTEAFMNKRYSEGVGIVTCQRIDSTMIEKVIRPEPKPDANTKRELTSLLTALKDKYNLTEWVIEDDTAAMVTQLNNWAVGVTGWSADAEPKPDWISVEDRLPDNGEPVIGFEPHCLENRDKGIGVIDADYDLAKNNMKSDGTYWVTHWMPLPEPPKIRSKS